MEEKQNKLQETLAELEKKAEQVKLELELELELKQVKPELEFNRAKARKEG